MTTRLVLSLSQWSGLSTTDIEFIIVSAPRRYKAFSIPKRSGGWRHIAQPSRELKILQRLVVSRVLHGLPVHDAAHGYVRGRGIRTNAASHAGSNFLLKLDLEDFFPSLKPRDLREHLRASAPELLTPEEVNQLSSLIFWKPKGESTLRLCIGAPSSPFLSNTLMYRLDHTLADLATRYGVTYTRYADDMTFSAMEPGKLGPLYREAVAILEGSRSPVLRVNQKKTTHISRAQRRMVTGIVLTAEGHLSVGRERKRLIRAMAHRDSLGALSEPKVDELEGLLGFATDVEPAFAQKMRTRRIRRA